MLASFHKLFKTYLEYIQADDEHQFAVTMSYLQIYLDTLQDFATEHRTHKGKCTPRCFRSNATTVDIYSLDDFLKVLEVGNGNRVSAFTNLNAHSSRSHACIICTVHKIKRPQKTERWSQCCPSRYESFSGIVCPRFGR